MAWTEPPRAKAKPKVPSPGEEIEHWAVWTDPRKNLLDEYHLGRWTGLQKRPRREWDGDTGQQYPDRLALDDDKLVEAGTPDDAGEVALLGEPREGLACAELRALCRLDHQVDAAVGAGESSLRDLAGCDKVGRKPAGARR